MTDIPRITVSVPARAPFATTLGIVADAAAAVSEFDADRIDDIDLAIEEIAGALIDLDGCERIAMNVASSPRRLQCELMARGPNLHGPIELDGVRSIIVDTVCDSMVVDDATHTIDIVITCP